MRVGIDVAVSSLNATGNARYSLWLLRALQSATQQTDISIVPLSLPGSIGTLGPGFRRKGFVLFWEFVYAPWLLGLLCRRHKCDLLHATAPTPIANVACPVVTTIHDVMPVTHQHWFPRIGGMRVRRWIKIAACRSTHIIVDSQSTARDLRRVLPNLGTPVSVIYPGSFLDMTPDAYERVNNDAWVRNHPHILSVGALDPRKNLGRVLEAFQLLVRHLPDAPNLLVVGSGGMVDDLKTRARQLGIEKHLVMAGHISDVQLKKAYREAALLIYPSLYEGFGFPLVEAMSSGCPIITSNAGSLPEVVGNAGITVDPCDVRQLAAAMGLILGNQVLALRLREQGLQRARMFSWEQCAQQTISIYRQVRGP